MRQLSIVEPRLVKVEYPADTYSYDSHMSDTEPSSQWMAENPHVRLLGILGRVQQWSQPPRTPNVAKRGTVWPTGHWWLGRAPKLGCDGPKMALPHIL